MHLSLRARAAFAAALTFFAACTGGPAEESAVSYVEYEARLVAASPADVEFSRIGHVAVDSKGMLYVVDAPSTLVVLDSAARFVRTVGKMGGGPGEFMRIAGVQVLPGDSLFVFDSQLSRATFYAPGQERPAQVQTLEQAELDFAKQVRRFPGGALVGHYATSLTPDGTFPERTTEFLRGARQDGKPSGTMLKLAGMDILSTAEGPGMRFTLPPFARRTIVQMGPQYIYALYNDSARVQVLDPKGTPVSAITPDVPVAPQAIAAASYDSIGDDQDPAARRAMRAKLESRWRTWPLYEALLVGDGGSLWIKPSNPAGPNRWFRVAADGTRTGSVVLPDGATPRVFARDRVYCVVKDDMDVETLAVYALGPAGNPTLARR